MAYCTRGSLKFTEAGFEINDAFFNCAPLGGDFAIRMGAEDRGICRVELYIAVKSLEERYADFTKRLAAAIKRHGALMDREREREG